MNIGYIVSLKQPGLIAWVYREMIGMEKLGAKIFVFPTKYFVGPLMPKKEWYTAKWNPMILLISQITWILKSPITYFKVLIIAIRYKAIIEFVLAGHFALTITEKGVERIHCHLGDRKLYVGFFSKLLTDIPLSVTIHAHELYINPNWKLFPVALNECDRVICIANLNKNILSKKWGIEENKLHVIRLFGFSNNKDNEPLIILCVGRFERKKGHDILLDAVS
jgi:glycosyltransferase involved in cell wall biosynthesis